MCVRPASIVPGTQLMPSPQWECSSWLEGGCCSGFGNLSDHSRGVAVLAFLTRRCWLAWTVDQRSQSPEPVGGLSAQLAAGKGREPCVRVRGAGQATQDSGWFCSCPDRAAVTLMTPRDVAQALGCPEETGSSNSQCPVPQVTWGRLALACREGMWGGAGGSVLVGFPVLLTPRGTSQLSLTFSWK